MREGTLVLVRHGESRMNALNLFTGWMDIPLSENGIHEAQIVAEECKRYDYDAAFTSNLERAHQTLLIILSVQRKIGIFQHHDDRYNNLDHLPEKFLVNTLPIYADEALNERAYGELQGEDKDDVAMQYGDEQVFRWRRGFAERPPGGESLEDVYIRVIAYFRLAVLPRLQAGETCLVTAHGNSLRALIKFLEHIEDDQIPFVNFPTGHSLTYSYANEVFERKYGSFEFDRPLR